MARDRQRWRLVRFTTRIPLTTRLRIFASPPKADALYVIGLAWPANGEAVIRSLAATVGSQSVQSVSLLGSDAKPKFQQRPDGLHVQLPAQAPAKYAYVLRLTF